VRVRSRQIEVELVGVGLGEKVAPAGEGLQIEKLVFHQPVDGFDVALIGVGGGRDAHVLAISQRGGEAAPPEVSLVAADELTAVVGLPDQVAQLDPVALQMTLDAGGEDRAGRGAESVGISQKEQPAADLARRVLEPRQPQLLRLGPVARDIPEFFGVGADLLEQPPGGLDGGQVLFASILPPTPADQSVLAPDAVDGHVAEGQVELALEPGGPESGQMAAQGDGPLFEVGRSLVRAVVRSPGVLPQPGQTLLLIASPPLAHGECTGGEQPGGGLDAALANRLDQAQAMVVGVTHFTHQIVVAGGGHGGPILAAARCPALPPAGQRSLSSASHSHTSTPPGGNDVPFQFHASCCLDVRGGAG